MDGLPGALGSILAVAYALLPVIWIVSLSLKPGRELGNGRFLPETFSLEHYRAVFTDPQFPAAILNSLGIASITTALSILIAVFAAYAIVRLEFRGKQWIFTARSPLPCFRGFRGRPSVRALAHAASFRYLARTHPPLFELHPAARHLDLDGFFREVPWELEKAARVDGATPSQAFRLVILPLVTPGIFASAILVFIFAWNDFLFAASLTSTDRARTVPVAIAFFTGSSQYELPVGSIAAASVVVTIPVIALVLVFQRRIIAGLTAGAVKG